MKKAKCKGKNKIYLKENQHLDKNWQIYKKIEIKAKKKLCQSIIIQKIKLS